MTPQNVEAFVGKTLALNLEVTLDGTPRDLTNDVLVAYLKPNAQTADGSALATLTEGDGIEVTDAAAGLMQVVFSTSQTTRSPGSYFYHITLQTSAGALYTIAHGLVTLESV
jgi:hypothetical protein